MTIRWGDIVYRSVRKQATTRQRRRRRKCKTPATVRPGQ